jgi:hypothetical protein
MERHSAQVRLTHRARTNAAAGQARVSLSRREAALGRYSSETCAAACTAPSIALILTDPRSRAA